MPVRLVVGGGVGWHRHVHEHGYRAGRGSKGSRWMGTEVADKVEEAQVTAVRHIQRHQGNLPMRHLTQQ